MRMQDCIFAATWILLSEATTVTASSEISWATVGITWFLCTLSTILIISILFCIRCCLRKSKRKKPAFKRDISLESDATSSPTKKTALSAQSSRTDNNRTPPYQAVPQREPYILNGPGIKNEPNRRRDLCQDSSRSVTDTTGYRDVILVTGDEVAKWCTENGISEHTASILRSNGFLSRHAIESIKLDDIAHLDLANKAQECLLRQVIEDKRSSKRSGGSAVPLLSENDDVFPPYGRSISNDNHRPQVPSNPRRFKGLLSDGGLYDLSKHMGMEWRQLGAQLEVSHSFIEQLQMNYPGDTSQQIAGLLRHWRDRQPGDKAEVKGRLCDALYKIDRNDLAEEIMREQVKGSMKKTKTSVI